MSRAFSFLFYRKKRCSGEMPCASCVNFNRDCCVYDRWSSSTSASKTKEVSNLKQQMAWAERNSITLPTTPCFTSKVLLTKVNNHTPSCCTPASGPAHSPTPLALQPPFVQQQAQAPASDNYFHDSLGDVPALDFSPWSPYDSPLSLQSTPLTPTDAMTRTLSLPIFQDRSWTQEDKAVAASSSSSSLLLPMLIMDDWTQDNSPLSLSSPMSPMDGPISSPFDSPNEFKSYQSLLYQGNDTQELLFNVDALLTHLGSPTST